MRTSLSFRGERRSISADRPLGSAWGGSGVLEIGFGESGHFEEVPEKPGLQGFPGVDGDGEADGAAGFPVDVVASIDPEADPPAAFEETGKVLARNLLHTAISMIWSFSDSGGSCLRSTERQPSTAS